MTPVGHAAVSYVLARGLRPWVSLSVLGVVIGGVLPDLDFVMFWAPDFNAWHRVITHNLVMCVAAALAAGAWGAWRGHGLRGALALGAGVGLGAVVHVVVDSTMDTNPSNGIGVAWLWPWSEQTYSPFNLMAWMPVEGNPAGWGDLGAAARNTLVQMVWELPFWGLAAWLWRRARTRARSPDGAT